MLFFETRVGPSPIAGKGVFSMTRIPRGAIVGDLTHKCEFLTEDEYHEAQRAGDRWVIQRAVRAVGRLFVYGAPATEETEIAFENEDYTNHNGNPTLLYHCGILFARRDIAAGEELTVNYKYFLAQGDAGSFVDAETGNLVSGLIAAEALRQSTHELLALLPFIAEESPAAGRALTRNRPRRPVLATSPWRMHSSVSTREPSSCEMGTGRGLEPPRGYSLVPETSASTHSATRIESLSGKYSPH